MPTTVEGKTIRLACNQSSNDGVIDKWSGKSLMIWQGATAQLRCTLFDREPASDSLVTDFTNVVSATLYVRKFNARGTVLLAKTILVAAMDTDVTWNDYVTDADQHFTFNLSGSDTNQIVNDAGVLPIYFSIKVVTTTSSYIAAFGYGKVIDVGIVDVAPPTPTGFSPVYTDSYGLVQNSVPTNFPFGLLQVGGQSIIPPEGFDVKSFGAVGDGIVNDTAAFNTALAHAAASNGVLYIPRGSFYLTSTLLFVHAGSQIPLGIVGSGPDSILVTDQNIPIITVDGVGGRIDGLRFQNFTLRNTNNALNNDVGISFVDTSGTPLGSNSVNDFRISNIGFYGLSCGILSSRNANAQEGGMNFCTFSQLAFWNAGGKTAKYNVHFLHGGGTGNKFIDLSGVALISNIEIGDGNVQNVGDMLFSGCHFGGNNVDSSGIKLNGPVNLPPGSPGDAQPYGRAISIVNCQFDAGVVHALNFSHIRQFSCLGTNWGGATDVVLSNCQGFKLDRGVGINDAQPGTPNLVFTNCTNYTLIGDYGTVYTTNSITTGGTIAAGVPATGFAAGDISASRTTTTGVLYLGSDAGLYAYRYGANGLLLGGATFLALSSRNNTSVGLKVSGTTLKVRLADDSGDAALTASNLSGTNTGDQDLSPYAPLNSPAFTGPITTNGTISAGSVATGFTNGDISASRTSGTGAIYIGSDGGLYFYRHAANSLQMAGVTLLTLGNRDGTAPGVALKVTGVTMKVRRGDDSADADLFAGALTLSGSLSATGTIAGSNLSGTNTGDQNLTPYALLASPAFTGTPTAPTAAAATNTTQIATTAFVTSAITTAVTGLLNFKGSTDCSGNPNYPSAVKGDSYIVSVAGKIGGASGTAVDVGDWYVCEANNAGGTEAAVGSSWGHMEHNLVGALLASNNLSDVANAGTARTNLGLAIGTNVQAYAANLTTWAGIAPGTGVGTALAVNVGSDGAFVTFNGALGTPSGGTLANASGLPESGVVNLVNDLALKAPLAGPSFTGAVAASGTIAVGTAPSSGFVAGDISASRTATTGAICIGSDAGLYLYRYAAASLQLAGVTFLAVANRDGSSPGFGLKVSGNVLKLRLSDDSGDASITALAGTFSGALTGSNLSGTNTGDQTSVSGNAGTATALQTARAINGVNFDGTAAITVAAAAGTITGTTLNSSVVTSSLSSVGPLTSLLELYANDGSNTVELLRLNNFNSAGKGSKIVFYQGQTPAEVGRIADYHNGSQWSMRLGPIGSLEALTVWDTGDIQSAGKIVAGAVIRLRGYTVATLPAATQGDTAFVTDATAPTFLAIIAGGGAVVTPVFYNGTNWVGF